jgi:hypothetical protein
MIVRYEKYYPRLPLKMGIPTQLQVFKWVPACGKDIPLDIHPKGQDEINDERRAHGEERDVNEPGPDTGSGYTHSLTDRRTHSKNLPLDEVFKLFHKAKLVNSLYLL